MSFLRFVHINTPRSLEWQSRHPWKTSSLSCLLASQHSGAGSPQCPSHSGLKETFSCCRLCPSSTPSLQRQVSFGSELLVLVMTAQVSAQNSLGTSHGCVVSCFEREGWRTFLGRRVSNSYVLSQEDVFLPASFYSRVTECLAWILEQYIELWKWSLSISSLFHYLLWQTHINVYRCLYSACGVALPCKLVSNTICLHLSVCQEPWALSLSEDASGALIAFSSNATIFHNLLQRVYDVAYFWFLLFKKFVFSFVYLRTCVSVLWEKFQEAKFLHEEIWDFFLINGTELL